MTEAVQPAERPSFRQLVATELRAHLARRRMSGRELSRRLGEANTWAARRLTGEVPFNTEDLDRIAAVLGMDVPTMLRDVQRWGSGSSPGGEPTFVEKSAAHRRRRRSRPDRNDGELRVGRHLRGLPAIAATASPAWSQPTAGAA